MIKCQQEAQRCCDSRSYWLWRTVYWQTIKPVSVTSWRTAGTHDPIQWVEFMNASELNPLKRDFPKFKKQYDRLKNYNAVLISAGSGRAIYRERHVVSVKRKKFRPRERRRRVLALTTRRPTTADSHDSHWPDDALVDTVVLRACTCHIFAAKLNHSLCSVLFALSRSSYYCMQAPHAWLHLTLPCVAHT